MMETRKKSSSSNITKKQQEIDLFKILNTLVEVATKKKTAEEAAKEFVEDNGQAIKEYIKAFSITFIQDIMEKVMKNRLGH